MEEALGKTEAEKRKGEHLKIGTLPKTSQIGVEPSCEILNPDGIPPPAAQDFGIA